MMTDRLGRELRVGDKVVCTDNVFTRELMLGKIVSINEDKATVKDIDELHISIYKKDNRERPTQTKESYQLCKID